MSKFVIGSTYKDQEGRKYIFLGEKDGVGTFQFNRIQKKFKLVECFGSGSMACNIGTRIISAPSSVVYDDELDGKKNHVFNLSGVTYVNLFKRHQEERSGNQ